MAAWGEAFVRPPLKQLIYGYLYDLFRLYSPSGQERDAAEYCQGILESHGFDVWQHPGSWNVYAVRGTEAFDGKFVVLNAHLDTVQRPSDEVVASDPWVVQYSVEADAFHTNGVAMLGGDDKCGLAIILALAAGTDLPMKILITVEEEIGCRGVKQVPAAFYTGCGFGFTLDRRGDRDIIKEYSGRPCAPDTFVAELIAIGNETVGVTYATASGSMADTYTISDRIPCVNLSVGYYNAHTANDYVVVHDTYTTALLVQAAIIQRNRLMDAIARAPTGWQRPAYGVGKFGRWESDWDALLRHENFWRKQPATRTVAPAPSSEKSRSRGKPKPPKPPKPARTTVGEFPKKYRSHLQDFVAGKIYVRGTKEYLVARLRGWVASGIISEGEYAWLQAARNRVTFAAATPPPPSLPESRPLPQDLNVRILADRLAAADHETAEYLLDCYATGYETVNGRDLREVLVGLARRFVIDPDDFLDASEEHRRRAEGAAKQSGWKITTTPKSQPRAVGFDVDGRDDGDVYDDELLFEEVSEWALREYEHARAPSRNEIFLRAVMFGADEPTADVIADEVLAVLEDAASVDERAFWGRSAESRVSPLSPPPPSLDYSDIDVEYSGLVRGAYQKVDDLRRASAKKSPPASKTATSLKKKKAAIANPRSRNEIGNMIVINRGRTNVLAHADGPVGASDVVAAISRTLGAAPVAWELHECAGSLNPGAPIPATALPVDRDVVVVVLEP